MTVEAPPRFRPGWVWGIFLFYIIWFLRSTNVQIMMALGKYPSTPSLQDYWNSLTSVDFTLGFALGALQVVAATYLWLLRRQALGLFLAAFLLTGANFARRLATKGLLDVITNLGIPGTVTFVVSMAFGLIFSAAICAYVWGLYKRGVLH